MLDPDDRHDPSGDAATTPVHWDPEEFHAAMATIRTTMESVRTMLAEIVPAWHTAMAHAKAAIENEAREEDPRS